MPGAGARDRRIVIQRRTSAANAFNELIRTWSDYATLWAARADVSDAERISAGQINASLQSRFIVRSTASTRTISPVDRIFYDDAYWNIHGVKETREGRNRYIEISAVVHASEPTSVSPALEILTRSGATILSRSGATIIARAS